MDIKGKILAAVDDDGSIRRTMSQPLVTPADINPAPPPIPVHDSLAIAAQEAAALPIEARPEHVIAAPSGTDTAGADAAVVATAGPPAFIPPRLAAAGIPAPPAPPPAFVPPSVVAQAARARRAALPYA